MPPLRLLPADALIHTGPVDHADWNYRPVLGRIQRRRLRLVAGLLPRTPVGRLLEVGYGSGVFLPELDTRANELFGIDPHPHPAAVAEILRRHGVTADLTQGTAEVMPYPDRFFDRVVAVSSLEFIPDLTAACREIARVLAPGGRLVLVTPGSSPVLDFGLRVLTGERAKDDYADRRERLLPTLFAHFRVVTRRQFPPLTGPTVRLYQAFELEPLPAS